MTLKTTTTKALVGPPIGVHEPPSNEMKKPATIAVGSPLSGEAPLAMPSAMARGNAMTATVMPAMASALNCAKP